MVKQILIFLFLFRDSNRCQSVSDCLRMVLDNFRPYQVFGRVWDRILGHSRSGLVIQIVSDRFILMRTVLRLSG